MWHHCDSWVTYCNYEEPQLKSRRRSNDFTLRSRSVVVSAGVKCPDLNTRWDKDAGKCVPCPTKPGRLLSLFNITQRGVKVMALFAVPCITALIGQEVLSHLHQNNKYFSAGETLKHRIIMSLLNAPLGTTRTLISQHITCSQESYQLLWVSSGLPK